MESEVIIQPDNWIVEDNLDDHFQIRLWGYTRKNEKTCFVIDDFSAWCYIDLPEKFGPHEIRWTDEGVSKIRDYINRRMPQNLRPFQIILKDLMPMYGYRPKIKECKQYLMCLFNNIEGMKYLERIMSGSDISNLRDVEISGIGYLKLPVWEVDIPVDVKLRTELSCTYCQWIQLKDNNQSVPDEQRITSADYEYHISWKDIVPLDSEKTPWVVNPLIAYVDIEVYSHHKSAFPDAQQIEDCIFMISVVIERYGQRETRESHLFVLGDCDPVGNMGVYRFTTELDMIYATFRLIAKKKVDVIAGYNILKFDIPYIQQRLVNFGKEFPPLSLLINDNTRIYKKVWKSDAYGYNEDHILQCEGRIIIDLLPIVKRDYKFSKYSLDVVAKEFLGWGKDDVSPREMFDTFDEFIDSSISGTDTDYEIAVRKMTRVAKYNEKDNVCVAEIVNKTNTIIGLVEMANVVGVSIVALFTGGQQARVLNLLYAECRNEKKRRIEANKTLPVDKQENPVWFVCDRKPPRMEDWEQDWEGGMCRCRTRKMEENVICVDFNSMYPMNMMARNISFDTFVNDNPKDTNLYYCGDKVPSSMTSLVAWKEDREERAKRRGNSKMLLAGSEENEQEDQVAFNSHINEMEENENDEEDTPVKPDDKLANKWKTRMNSSVTEKKEYKEVSERFQGCQLFDENNNPILGRDPRNPNVYFFRQRYINSEFREGLLARIVRNLVDSRKAVRKSLAVLSAQAKFEDKYPKYIEEWQKVFGKDSEPTEEFEKTITDILVELDDAKGNKVAILEKNIENKIKEFLGSPNLKDLIVDVLEIKRKFPKIKENWVSSHRVNRVMIVVLEKKQLALKLTANSCFGFMGALGGKREFMQGAMAVTATGRELIIFVNNYIVENGKTWLEEFGIKDIKEDPRVVYNDTDSSMVAFGIKDPAITNLFGVLVAKKVNMMLPKPTAVDFEKAMYRFLAFKEKKYIAVLISSKGIPILNRKKMIIRGITLSRRDNCEEERDIYSEVMEDIMFHDRFEETIYNLQNRLIRLASHCVPVQRLAVIRSIGQKYKSSTYFMKIFQDYLTSVGKPVRAGDRLEYIVIENEETKIGNKMRLLDQWNDHNEAYMNGTYLVEADKAYIPEKPMLPDVEYYIEKILNNKITQLLMVGYHNHFVKLLENYAVKMLKRISKNVVTQDVEDHFIQELHKKLDESFNTIKKDGRFIEQEKAYKNVFVDIFGRISKTKIDTKISPWICLNFLVIAKQKKANMIEIKEKARNGFKLKRTKIKITIKK